MCCWSRARTAAGWTASSKICSRRRRSRAPPTAGRKERRFHAASSALSAGRRFHGLQPVPLPDLPDRRRDPDRDGTVVDRRSVVEGKSVSVSVALGGLRIVKKKKQS